VEGNQACASCHMPYAGFGGPIPSVNLTTIAYPGSFHFRFGKRTPQRYTYSPDFPVLNYNTTQGAFFGGNFWDARSTGFKLQSADAEQAQHPPLDSQEMGSPDLACIAFKISQAEYLPLFKTVWGATLLPFIGRPTLRQSAAPPQGLLSLARTPRQLLCHQTIAPRQTMFMITGGSQSLFWKARTMSVLSHPNSMLF